MTTNSKSEEETIWAGPLKVLEDEEETLESEKEKFTLTEEKFREESKNGIFKVRNEGLAAQSSRGEYEGDEQRTKDTKGMTEERSLQEEDEKAIPLELAVLSSNWMGSFSEQKEEREEEDGKDDESGEMPIKSQDDGSPTANPNSGDSEELLPWVEIKSSTNALTSMESNSLSAMNKEQRKMGLPEDGRRI